MRSQSCLSCGGPVAILVDFGPQTPSNRFERLESPVSDCHPLIIGQCGDCGLIQLLDPMIPGMVKSRFEWLTYNEPEGHLDDLVSRLRELPGIGRHSRIAGLTYKDDTTLTRFSRLGYKNTYRYQLEHDFGLTDPCAGLESIQAALDGPMAEQLAARRGLADLLIVRHILEHAHDLKAFLRAAAALVRPGGYLLFEMPDCSKFMRACDYSFVWEEHITYFNSVTLAALVRNAGLAMKETFLYSYPLEDSLIGVVCNASGTVFGPAVSVKPLLADGAAFARAYPRVKEQMISRFVQWRNNGMRIAVFGAGHLAAKFINLYDLTPHVDCVVEDNTHKQGLLMPGSRLPILGSAALDDRLIDICLLSLNPESEQRVRAKNQRFLDRGGRFFSIFALGFDSVYEFLQR